MHAVIVFFGGCIAFGGLGWLLLRLDDPNRGAVAGDPGPRLLVPPWRRRLTQVGYGSVALAYIGGLFGVMALTQAGLDALPWWVQGVVLLWIGTAFAYVYRKDHPP